MNTQKLPNLTVKLPEWVFLWLLLMGSVVPRMFADSVDPRKPYGRVCISVVNGSGGEVPFDAKASYGSDERLAAHLDANARCLAVTLALDPANGHLANGWRPEAVELAEAQEIVLPRKPVVWNFTSVQPFDFYVLFLDSASRDAQEIKRLIEAMQTSKIDSQLLTIQTNKLHELITRQLAGSEPSSHAAVIPLPEQIGGELRGGSDEFPWRRFSVRVNFSEIQPGMLIFSSRWLENKK